METKNLTNLKDKVAIITGSSKGIGLAIAKGLAEAGAAIVISSRKQDVIDEVVASLNSDGFQAVGISCHVGRKDQLNQLVEQTVKAFGGVDILINNAATNPVFGPLVDVDDILFEKIMNINLTACHTLSNLCHPIMKQRGGGSIINVASVEGLKPSFGLGVYSISKAALIMLTKNQAKEWGKDNIRSNALCPGLVQTKFSSAIWQNDKILDQIKGQLPLRRMAQPEEMVGLALMLASSAGSYCTGGVYTADGGHMLA